MPPREPVRRKKTKKEASSARAKMKQKAVQEKRTSDRRQVNDLKKDRVGLQGHLAGVVRQVKAVVEKVNSEEFKSKMAEEDVEVVNTAARNFKNTLGEHREGFETAIKELENMETSVAESKATLEDIVLPYNLTMAPMIECVTTVGQKAVETLASCTEVLKKYEDNEVSDDVG